MHACLTEKSFEILSACPPRPRLESQVERRDNEKSSYILLLCMRVGDPFNFRLRTKRETTTQCVHPCILICKIHFSLPFTLLSPVMAFAA